MVPVLAAGWAPVAAAATRVHDRDVVLFLVLLACGAVSVEATRRLREPAGTNANDMLSAWWIPIAVLLPPVYSLLAPVPLMALTQWRVRRVPTHRRVFSAGAIGLAHAGASTVFHALPAEMTQTTGFAAEPLPLTLAVAAAGMLAMASNAALVGAAVKGSDPQTRWRGVFLLDARLEVTEVCAGVLVALLAALDPVLVLVVLPPVLLLQRGMMYAQLNAAAHTDAKTGLLNAVTWERESETELARAWSGGHPAAVLLLDIDRFKDVNDTHGHLAGDDVLRGVAATLHGHSRQGRDLVGRFGGEEFAVFLPGLDAAGAVRAAERLRCALAELATPAGDALIRVTVSIGVAVAEPSAVPHAGVPELLAVADLGLYRAKGHGRDQVQLIAH